MEIKVGSEYRHFADATEVVTVTGTPEGYVTFSKGGTTNHCVLVYDFEMLYRPVLTVGRLDTNSVVNAPQHYQVFPDKEAIEIIASSMTTEQFYGYCLGNFLKYRLRIGAKDEVQQDLGKSNKYKELYEKHKHLCK